MKRHSATLKGILCSAFILGLLFLSAEGITRTHQFSYVGDKDFHTHFNFVRVEPGEFVMGSPETEPGRYPDEIQHTVKITRPYEIGVTEVTQGLWKKVMGKLPKDVLQVQDDLPITYVSWEDVRVFLKRLGEMRKDDGYTYRLPTEAEWEYAARGAHRTTASEKAQTFSFGNDAKQITKYGWSWANSPAGAQPVASLKPNQLGLYDMVGNVWEWMEDTYSDDPSQVKVNPEFGHPVNLAKGKTRVLRSGCWTRNSRVMRSAFRGNVEPDSDFGNLGVRLVRVAM